MLKVVCVEEAYVGVAGFPIAVKALQDIKRSLVDPNKNLTNWNRGDPCTSNWTGVLCYNRTLENGYLHVIELYDSFFVLLLLIVVLAISSVSPFPFSPLYKQLASREAHQRRKETYQ